MLKFFKPKRKTFYATIIVLNHGLNTAGNTLTVYRATQYKYSIYTHKRKTSKAVSDK